MVLLTGVSHFAPLQRPEQFNTAMLAFIGKALQPAGMLDTSETTHSDCQSI
jgi:hypothetical protein